MLSAQPLVAQSDLHVVGDRDGAREQFLLLGGASSCEDARSDNSSSSLS